jgi:hypothetical protein
MHEKTVLLPLSILCLALPRQSTHVLCVTIAALLSMHDLLHRDGHALTYSISMLLLIPAVMCSPPSGASEKAQRAATVCAVILFHAAQALLPPPPNYPWLYPYLAALLCCIRQDTPPSSSGLNACLGTSLTLPQPFVVDGLCLLALILSPFQRRCSRCKIRLISVVLPGCACVLERDGEKAHALAVHDGDAAAGTIN